MKLEDLVEKEELPSVDTLTAKQLAKKHGVPESEINAAIKKGTKHEFEHTKKKKVAQEIAMDHIGEDPKYYDKLEKIEH